MSSHLYTRTLLNGPALSVYDVACQPECGDCGPEEYSDAFEVVFPRRGCFVKHSGGQESLADAHSVLLLQPGETYRVSHPVAGGDDCTVVRLSAGALQELTGEQPDGHRPADAPRLPYHCVTLPDDRHFLLQQLRLHLRSGDPDTLAVEETGLRLVNAVLAVHRSARASAHQADAAVERTNKERAEAVKTVLVGRLSEPLTLHAIAREVHTSPYHLARVFRRMTGSSIHQYRNRLRLRTAIERILQGEADLTRLALDIGYSSHSHLSTAFGQAFGSPPSALRHPPTAKRIREMSTNLKV